MNSAITGVNGGLVVVAADDPSMHSSQNEQDSRFYGNFAMIPILEPSSQQEVYGMMKYAFELSERVKLPVLLRIVTRLAHSRAGVRITDSIAQNPLNPSNERSNWVLLPGNAKKQYASLVKKQDLLKLESENSPYNIDTDFEKSGQGIIACGIAFNYVMENDPTVPVLKISQYPLPEATIKEFARRCSSILVAEDGQPVVENLVKGILGNGYPVKGRLTGDLPRMGELTPDNVGAAMGIVQEKSFSTSENVMPRPPALCQGCGHRDVYNALNEILKGYEGARIFGDIGCLYLLLTGAARCPEWRRIPSEDLMLCWRSSARRRARCSSRPCFSIPKA